MNIKFTLFYDRPTVRVELVQWSVLPRGPHHREIEVTLAAAATANSGISRRIPLSGFNEFLGFLYESRRGKDLHLTRRVLLSYEIKGGHQNYLGVHTAVAGKFYGLLRRLCRRGRRVRA